MGHISHGAFYALVRDGLVNPIRVGRSCFFDLGDIDSFMEGLKAEQHGEPRRTAEPEPGPEAVTERPPDGDPYLAGLP